MPGGRPRKPTAIKILEGTFRADRDGAAAAVPEPEGQPSSLHLGGEALEFWGRITPGLVARGVAKACDSEALVMLAEWWARGRECSRALESLAVNEKGAYQLLVMCGIATTHFDRLASRFGLTPSDRARLRIEPAGVASRTPVPPRKRG